MGRKRVYQEKAEKKIAMDILIFLVKLGTVLYIITFLYMMKNGYMDDDPKWLKILILLMIVFVIVYKIVKIIMGT